MRYQRLSYRYALVWSPGEPRSLGELERAERLGVRLARPLWRPPADVYESATAIAVTIELAGVDLEEMDVLLYEDAVVVEGERRLPPADPRGVYHSAEIHQGRFRLDLPLPALIDPDGVEAHYDRGILRMTLTKKADWR